MSIRSVLMYTLLVSPQVRTKRTHHTPRHDAVSRWMKWINNLISRTSKKYFMAEIFRHGDTYLKSSLSQVHTKRNLLTPRWPAYKCVYIYISIHSLCSPNPQAFDVYSPGPYKKEPPYSKVTCREALDEMKKRALLEGVTQRLHSEAEAFNYEAVDYDSINYDMIKVQVFHLLDSFNSEHLLKLTIATYVSKHQTVTFFFIKNMQ